MDVWDRISTEVSKASKSIIDILPQSRHEKHGGSSTMRPRVELKSNSQASMEQGLIIEKEKHISLLEIIALGNVTPRVLDGTVEKGHNTDTPMPVHGKVHIAALEKDWHSTDSMLGFYLEKHEVDFEVTFVDGDPTWEVAIGGQDEGECVGGALKLPVVVLGRDVWWGETKEEELASLLKRKQETMIRLQGKGAVGWTAESSLTGEDGDPVYG